MYLKPGDLQIMNNNTVFHSRTAYEDYADADKKRLLYRLWIARKSLRSYRKVGMSFTVKLALIWCEEGSRDITLTSSARNLMMNTPENLNVIK